MKTVPHSRQYLFWFKREEGVLKIHCNGHPCLIVKTQALTWSTCWYVALLPPLFWIGCVTPQSKWAIIGIPARISMEVLDLAWNFGIWLVRVVWVPGLAGSATLGGVHHSVVVRALGCSILTACRREVKTFIRVTTAQKNCLKPAKRAPKDLSEQRSYYRDGNYKYGFPYSGKII